MAEKLAFTDNDKLCVWDGEKVTRLDSAYILRYREYVATRRKNDEWKVSGEGARFRGDVEGPGADREEQVFAYINGVDWEGDKLVYCFTVNGSSGVCRKDPENEKAKEEHIFSSSDTEILSVHENGGLIAVTVRTDEVTSGIGTLNARTSELITLTGGDARDSNARFSKNGDLLFDSAGVGRTADGSFSGKYAPSVLMRLDPNTLELTEIKGSEKFSYVKPKEGPGGLYCIRRPNREKRGGGVLLDVLLFPFRIIKALFGFLQAFTVIFGNTSLTSASEGGDNPTKGKKTNTRKLFVDGKLIEAEKEQKRNKKFKDREYGFIPASWKLIRADGGEEVLASGVCDFAFADDGTLYYTDGRHVYRRKDGKEEKLATCECCLAVAVPTACAIRDESFF